MPRSTRRIQVKESAGSLELTFPYDPVLVRIVKAIPGRAYDPYTRAWRIPKTDASLRPLFSELRLYNVHGYERVEAVMKRSLPNPNDLWWADDMPEAG